MSRAWWPKYGRFAYIRSHLNDLTFPDDAEKEVMLKTPADVQALSASDTEAWFRHYYLFRHYGPEASVTAFQKEKPIAFFSGQDIPSWLL
ncbi:hypothetical protein IAR50_003122 [Cryptococcus sp. DSM 104548]